MPRARTKQIDLATFGSNVRRERVSRKLTQEQLAELAEVNPRTIQKIEAGKLNILITTVWRLQSALDHVQGLERTVQPDRLDPNA